VAFDFVGRAFGNLAAEIEHGNPVRNAGDERHVVLDQKHGDAARVDLLDDGGKAVQTGKSEDQNVWRVPTLRNLTYTAPYFHNGLVKFIPEAVRVMAATQLNKSTSDDQVADITAFLESLTGEFPAQTMPRLPPTPGDMLE